MWTPESIRLYRHQNVLVSLNVTYISIIKENYVDYLIKYSNSTYLHVDGNSLDVDLNLDWSHDLGPSSLDSYLPECTIGSHHLE